jgi:hypothetical protein
MKLRRIGTAGLFAAAALSVWVAPATTAADPPVARDPGVIVEWNEITERTLGENLQPIFQSILYYGFTALAMYDAVVTIEGGFEPWSKLPRAHAHASPEVAAATAAYRVLVHYFPGSADNLSGDYQATLAAIPNGVGKVHGIRVGEDAAAALIARHLEKGIGATRPPPFDEPLEAGEWRPTPPANLPMAADWLGFMKPLVVSSPTAIPLAGPPALTSDQYATEFAEVRDYGALESVGDFVLLRTDEQTETALFHTISPRFQHIDAIRDQITGRGLDIVDAAHALAVFDASMADAAMSCWRAKYDFAFWRPVTAIALADTDGNPDTDVVPGWSPLRATPPYPDYTSGHACFVGSVSGSLDNLFGPGDLTRPYLMKSYRDGVSDRSYPTTDALDTETMNARIWNGFHFRTAMTDGNALGHAVADTVAASFHPTD